MHGESNMKSSEVEEIMGVGSFEKGLRAELRGRLREEQDKLVLYGVAFASGLVIGVIASDRIKR